MLLPMFICYASIEDLMTNLPKNVRDVFIDYEVSAIPNAEQSQIKIVRRLVVSVYEKEAERVRLAIFPISYSIRSVDNSRDEAQEGIANQMIDTAVEAFISYFQTQLFTPHRSLMALPMFLNYEAAKEKPRWLKYDPTNHIYSYQGFAFSSRKEDVQ